MPFTSYFPHVDIHELLFLDLLHQIIKGTFKDHLVTLVEEYIKIANTPLEAAAILAYIDHRIAAMPPFPGRGFKQWTGDDSKALMKVYLPAIARHVPPQMVQTLAAFMEFFYYVQCSVIDKDTLLKIDAAVTSYHMEREIFCTVREFGASNGLCLLITESKHIKAALGQMLLINEHLDKLAATQVDFQAWGMLKDLLFNINEEEDSDVVDSPDVLTEVLWNLSHLTTEELNVPPEDVELQHCPQYHGKVIVYPLAVAMYYAPSDLSGVGGLHWECIHAMADWHRSGPCYDCVFCEADGLHVTCVWLFFSLQHENKYYLYALVTWFSSTGMWIVQLDLDAAGKHIIAHLIGSSNSLNIYPTFFVNKYTDHHVHEIAF
ncbi:hypothetical protein F5146DRAFT_1105899 [Armillaria mellea]|nr:hypothetical protein F5146DRAFT_1105899 [Armillaria mellea]